MFCAPASHDRVPPPPLPHLLPWRSDFSFLKDNSCSKWSSRCSRVSQNEICRSEQEAFIVFFWCTFMSALLWMEKPLHITYWLPRGSLTGGTLQQPPPTSSSGGIGWAEIFVFKPQTLWPFIYGHQDKNISPVLKWRQLSRWNISLCTSQHHFRVWQTERRWWEAAPRRLKVGWGGGGTRGTQPGQDAGSLSRKNNKHDFWALETPCVPVPIVIPWGKISSLQCQ